MKTIIFYATKNGATREIAQRIAKKMEGAVLHDLKQDKMPSLADFDRIIIGSSVYVGMIRKEAKAFLAQNAEQLQGKRLGLFLSGLQGGEEKVFFDTNFPAAVLKTAKVAMFLGGIFDPKKAGVMGRLVMKVVAKKAEYIDCIDDKKIGKFVEILSDGK